MTFISNKYSQSIVCDIDYMCDSCGWFSSKKGRDSCKLLEFQSFRPGVSCHPPPRDMLGHWVVMYEMQSFNKNYFQVTHVFLKYLHMNSCIISHLDAK